MASLAANIRICDLDQFKSLLHHFSNLVKHIEKGDYKDSSGNDLKKCDAYLELESSLAKKAAHEV